jgi:hypothetical protein
MSVLVVSSPLLTVGKNRISFGEFLESLFGLLIAGVLIRMMLNSQLAIGLFEFGFAGVAVDAEHLIIVSLFQVRAFWEMTAGQGPDAESVNSNRSRVSPAPAVMGTTFVLRLS